MKDFLLKQKGVIVFYIVIAGLAVLCTYRMRVIKERSEVNNNKTIIVNVLANK